MTILVMGGSGLIGTKVVNLLVTSGFDVTSFDSIRPKVIPERTRIVAADALELTSISRVLTEHDVEAIVHLIGLPVVDYCERNPQESFLLNVASTQNILEATRKADVKKVVFASSAAIYGEHSETALGEENEPRPVNVYGYHKLLAEQCLAAYSHSYGLNGLALRLFNVYGGNPATGKDIISTFIKKAWNKQPLIVTGPNKFRDFVHVDDVAKAFVRAVESKTSNAAINIGTGTRTTLREVAYMARDVFGDIEIMERPTSDDETGLFAQIKLAEEMLSFSPTGPREGIPRHLAMWLKK